VLPLPRAWKFVDGITRESIALHEARPLVHVDPTWLTIMDLE
jgi:hypothetical protein